MIKNKILGLIQELSIHTPLGSSITSRLTIKFLSHSSIIGQPLGFHNKISPVFLPNYLSNALLWISKYRLMLHICKFVL